jgi:sterol desaturase/sphingolipid hydroxylase (fatty acid hydroxylase superfamily)
MNELKIASEWEWAALCLGGMIAVIFPLELWRLFRDRAKQGRWLELLASASPLVPTLFAGGIVAAFIAGLYGSTAQFSLWKIPTTPLSIVLTLVVVDFLYYWDHRCAHENRSYWAIAHSVHHSSPHFDQTTALRVSFVDGFISPWFYLPLVVIGVDPLQVLGALGVIIAYQQWLHTELIGRLPLFDSWLNTPSNHRVHHAMQAQYLDKNYGAILMIWDRMFGTYAREEEPVQYGLTEQINSSNPIIVHVAEAVKLTRDVWHSGSIFEALGYLWHKPGWIPTRTHQTFDD